MSCKITVNEYAKKHQISRQTVYNRVKNGLLESIEEDGSILVYDDIKEVSKGSKDKCQKFVKKLLKRIDKLEKQLNKERKSKDTLILAYVDEMKALYLPKPKTKKKKK